MEVAHHRIAQAQGHADRRVHDLRELRVEGGGEGQAAAQAVAPAGPTQRAFGGEVDGVRLEGIELVREPLGRRDGEVDAGVAGTRARAELPRFDHLHLMAGGP